MTYQELEQIIEGRTLPLAARNADDENVIIEQGEEQGFGRYFRLSTAQHNGWTRVNYIYENGSTEEHYAR